MLTSSNVLSIPGAHEKRIATDVTSSYLELLQVLLAEKAKAWQDDLSKGTRQVSGVTSGQTMPAVVLKASAGLSNKGRSTVYQKHSSQQSGNA